jgi:hypothetical protein
MIQHLNGELDPADFDHRLLIVRNGIRVLMTDDKRRGDAAIGNPRTLVPPTVIPDGARVVCLVSNRDEQAIDAYFHHPSFGAFPDGNYPVDDTFDDLRVFGRKWT